MSRILFATDFHGHQPAYEALVAVAQARRPTAVVLGGDLLPFPMVGEDPVDAQRRFLVGPLTDVLSALRAADARVFAIQGNDDWAAAVSGFGDLEARGLLSFVHRRAIPLMDGWWIAGLGLVPVTPFYMCDFDRRDDEGWAPAAEPPTVLMSDTGVVREASLEDVYARPSMAEELGALAAASDPARTVYVVHTPPADCCLDLMHGHQHVGSGALRRFLEANRPPLSLHGHIHEAPDLSGSIADRVGDTLCVNPGAAGLGFRAAWLDLEDLAGPVELIQPEATDR